MRGLRRIRGKIWVARQKFRPKAAILMYHRIIDLPNDPYKVAVSPDNFAQQMEHIKRKYQPISLPEMVEAIQKNAMPRKAVVVTFDDGYFDNYTNARPILEALQIPWTLFVTTNLIGSKCDTWWDELANVMIESPNVPAQLQLNMQGQRYAWPMTTGDERQSACFDLHPILLPMTASDRNQIIEQLFKWAGIAQTPRSNYRMMTPSELAEVAQSKYVDLGAHTHTHPYLSSLSKEDQLKEIVVSRNTLQEKYNQSISTFAYPFGNFTDDTVEGVQEAGFQAAVTVQAAHVQSDTDLFLLGRYQVENWQIDQFSQKLKAVFKEVRI